MKYRVELTENQMKVVQTALEEYFRLRMGQDMDFCDDMAGLNFDLSPDNPNRNVIFNAYIARRNHLRELMRAFFRIAFEPEGYIRDKTGDMLIAECIWDAVRFARGLSRWDRPYQTGSEPLPKIEKYE